MYYTEYRFMRQKWVFGSYYRCSYKSNIPQCYVMCFYVNMRKICKIEKLVLEREKSVHQL